MKEWNDLNDPTYYHRDKQRRKEYYEKYVKGWKLHTCVACNGSGYSDRRNSPKCGSCDGTGKEKRPPTK